MESNSIRTVLTFLEKFKLLKEYQNALAKIKEIETAEIQI